jgi:hypothetical protein
VGLLRGRILENVPPNSSIAGKPLNVVESQKNVEGKTYGELLKDRAIDGVE